MDVRGRFLTRDPKLGLATIDRMKGMTKPLRVLCFGMGAIGTYIGGSLAARGAQVTFIEKPELVQGNQHPEIILEIGGEILKVKDVKITSDLRAALKGEKFDVALLAVKSFDTPSVLQMITKAQGSFPPILCLQNGVENEELIEKSLGSGSVIGGTITSAVGRSGLGSIRLEKLRGVGIEENHVLSRELIEWFNLAGLRARGYSSRANMKWSKMLTNLLANATAAILNWTPKQVFSYSLTWHIELAQIRETLAVMKAINVHLVNLPGTPVIGLMSLLKALPEDLSRFLIGIPLAKGRGAKMPSFHIDLYAGKTVSEVSYLNGAVVRFAERCGIKTPVNHRLCVLLEGMSAGETHKEDFENRPEKLMEWIWGNK